MKETPSAFAREIRNQQMNPSSDPAVKELVFDQCSGTFKLAPKGSVSTDQSSTVVTEFVRDGFACDGRHSPSV